VQLGEMVKEYRLKKNMTQLQLATKLGYEAPQFVHLMEQGKSKVPLKVIGKLVKILGLPKDSIIAELLHEYEVKITTKIKAGEREK
jgi:transcriptional regulator with XRE-family HTH domain